MSSKWITTYGILIMACAALWWGRFYMDVQSVLGVKGPLPVECLYSSAGPCSLAMAGAHLVGVLPYDPIAFWIGAAVFVFGILVAIERAQKRQERIRVSPRWEAPPEPRDRVEPHF